MKSTATRTTTTEPTSPVRDRLLAQITIQKGQLAVKELQVTAGEIDAADLPQQRQRITNLENELAALDFSEARDRQLKERRRTELPVLEPELKEKARRAARLLNDAREALREVQTVHAAILDLSDPRFPGSFVVPGLTNRDLVVECGSGSQFLREMTGKGELLDRWLATVKAAGVEV